MGVKNQVALSSITLTFSLKQHSVFPHVTASGDQGTTPIVNKGPLKIWGQSSGLCDLPGNRTQLSSRLERGSHPITTPIGSG